MLNKSKILITGGSGFIGTNLVADLIKNDIYQFLNIDVSKPVVQEHFAYWVNQDILEFDSLKKIIIEFNPDYIIHLAARTDIYGKTVNDYSTNTIGVENIVNIVLKLENLKKIIFTSSMLVNKPGYDKDAFYNPYDNAYAKSKVIGENIVKDKLRNSGVNFIIVRPTSIWGPYFKEPYRDFFMKVINRQFFHIGTINCYKTYGYVKNVVNQYISIIELPVDLVNNQVFYLGDDEIYNIRVWANEIATENRIKIYTLPLLFFKILALLGDLLSIIKINFPITSYRLKNLTTDNIIKINPIINNFKKTTRLEGIKTTLDYLNKIK